MKGLLVVVVVVLGCVVSEATATRVEMKSTLSLQNDFLQGEWNYFEKMFFALLTVYLVISVMTRRLDNVVLKRWTTIARVFPEYDMWNASIPEDSDRRDEICVDWGSLTRRYTLEMGDWTDEDRRNCYIRMLSNIDDDPHSTYKRGSKSWRGILGMIGMMSKIGAGMLAMKIANELVRNRPIDSSDLPRSTILENYAGVGVFCPFEVTLGGVLVNAFDLVAGNSSTIARCVAETGSTSLKDNDIILSLPSNDAGQISVQGSTLTLLGRIILSRDITSDHSGTVTTLRSALTKSNLQNCLSNALQVFHPHLSGVLVNSISISPQVIVNSISTSKAERERSNTCGPLASSVWGYQSRAYDHAASPLVCPSGIGFGAICELQCEPGFMTGDRLGSKAVCGIEQASGVLKWLPSYEAYQHMCSPDPIHRLPYLVVHLSTEVPMTATKWRNFGMDRNGPDASCSSGSCFTVLPRGVATDTLIHLEDAGNGLLGTHWNGDVPALELSGIDLAYSRFYGSDSTLAAPTGSQFNPLSKGVTIITVVGGVESLTHTNGLSRLQNAQSILPIDNVIDLATTSNTFPDLFPSNYMIDNKLAVVAVRAGCSCSSTGCTLSSDSGVFVNGISAGLTFASDIVSGTDCAVCCDSLQDSLQFLSLAETNSGELVGGTVSTSARSLTGNDLLMDGLLCELVTFASSLSNKQLHQASMFMASKWAISYNMAPATPPAPTVSSCIGSSQEYRATITFPKQGTFLRTAEQFKLRGCYCSSAITTAETCAAAGNCQEIAFGQSSLTFFGMVSASSNNGAFNFVLQAQSGWNVERSAWSSNLRPPFIGCSETSDSYCWVSSPITTNSCA